MRCKKHIYDGSSGVGVCASCLRERLITAQIYLCAAQSHSPSAPASGDDSRESDFDPHPPPQPPPQLLFPRSVSPYTSHRKAEGDRRFFSTPQVGPTYTTSAAVAPSPVAKKKRSKLSFLARIFKPRSDKSQPEPHPPSPRWFSSIVRRRSHPVRTARGASPEDSPCVSGRGYSSEAWRKTAPESAARRARSVHARNVSDTMAFCLSPLVRASPSRSRKQKAAPPDIGYSEEIRVRSKPHLSAAASFCANRSRKIADFGRSNHNH